MPQPGHQEHALGGLQRVTDAALAYLSEDELLTELLHRITEILHTDTAAILLLDEERGVLRAHAARGIEEEVEQGVEIPLGQGFAGRVAAERRPVYIREVDHRNVLNPILREKGIHSLLGVPLLVEGRVLGVLHVGSLTPREFSPDDYDLLQLTADRAAIAIEHAQLFQLERRARRRLETLQSITDAALAYLPQDELLPELLDRITEALETDTAAILLMEPNGVMLRARVAKGIEEEVEQGVQIPVGQGFAGRIVALRRAVTIEDVDHADILNPILREKGIRSLLGVPLLVEGRALGVLHVGSLTPRRFTAEERDLLQLAGDRAAIAIEHAQLFEQRHLAETLQRRLLPEQLADVSGLQVESRYLPASGQTLGGDWYDAFTLGGGRIVVAVGDVVGHGVLAAAVMAQLRTALRAYAIDGHEPAAVVDRVNRLMFGLGPGAMTTLAYAVIDPEHETLELVNAGHPPPLIVTPGDARELPLQGNMALGASELARYRSEIHPFEAGAGLLLYTDGLVERRGHSIEDGLEALRQEAAAFGPGTDLCDHLVNRLVGPERRDDIALIVARVEPLSDRLSGTWPATRESLAPVRRMLRRWLRGRGASEDEIYDVTVACQEACANAIEHAYRPADETFELDVHDAGEGRIQVTVRDHGQWRSPRGTNRGRGLVLMRALMESVDVQHDESGTVVVLERTLRRSVPV